LGHNVHACACMHTHSCVHNGRFSFWKAASKHTVYIVNMYLISFFIHTHHKLLKSDPYCSHMLNY